MAKTPLAMPETSRSIRTPRTGDDASGCEPCWETLPLDENNLVWTVDSENGLVQGPLDLGFFCGKKMLLDLGEKQVALLIDESAVQTVYLAGTHQLHIGNGKGGIAPDRQMLFMATDCPIKLRWKKHSSIWVSNIAEFPEEIKIIGSCSCEITGPGRFYQTFLANIETIDVDFITRVIDSLVRSQIESWLSDLFDGYPYNAVELQSRLTGLDPDTMNDQLEQYGIACRSMAIYTATPPVELQDVETAGQLGGDGEYWY